MSEPTPPSAYPGQMKSAIEAALSDCQVQINICGGGFIIGWWDWENDCARKSVFTTAEEVGAFLTTLLKTYAGPDESPEQVRVSEIVKE